MRDVIEILNADPRVIAYPQLVAALRKMLANGPGADHGLGAELSARDLLRELGEVKS